MPLEEDGDAGDQLSVGKIFLQGGGDADVHVEAGVRVFEEAVPGAAVSGPLDALPEKTLDVRVVAYSAALRACRLDWNRTGATSANEVSWGTSS